MKKLLYVLMILAVASCKKDNDPSPNLQVLEKQQAPFGKTSPEIVLRKVSYNDHLSKEYLYDGNVLIGQKGYVFFTGPVLYMTGSVRRSNGMVDSVSAMSGSVLAESQHVSKDFRPFYSMIFNKPETDSVRVISRKNHISPETYYSKYTFDSKGFIAREDLSKQYSTCIDTYIITSEMMKIMCRKAGTQARRKPLCRTLLLMNMIITRIHFST